MPLSLLSSFPANTEGHFLNYKEDPAKCLEGVAELFKEEVNEESKTEDGEASPAAVMH